MNEVLKQLDGLARRQPLAPRQSGREALRICTLDWPSALPRNPGATSKKSIHAAALRAKRLDSARALALLSQLEQQRSLSLWPPLVGNYPTIEKPAARLHQLIAVAIVESNA